MKSKKVAIILGMATSLLGVSGMASCQSGDSSAPQGNSNNYGNHSQQGNSLKNHPVQQNTGNAKGNTGNTTGNKKSNPLNVERVSGEVTDKKVITNPDGSSMVSITLSTPSEDIKVLLAPSSYLDASRVGVQIGDTVEIKGSRMQVNGSEMMIASEINKNGNVIPLRDDKGNPMWKNATKNSK